MTAITKDRNDLMKQIVIGMTAHADSGKTTLPKPCYTFRARYASRAE